MSDPGPRDHPPRDPDARAWGLPGVVDYFEGHRRSTPDVYRSEWIFLRELLREGITILDVGCALGGFAAIIGEHLGDFTYTGIDISDRMIARARTLHPRHEFLQVEATTFSALGGRRFDLVLCLGILHLNERWLELLEESWSRASGTILFDLRETEHETVTDRARAFFRMNFHGHDHQHESTVLPYNLINTAEALREVVRLGGPSARVARHGYLHDVRDSAVVPYGKVMMTTYCMDRAPPAPTRA